MAEIQRCRSLGNVRHWKMWVQLPPPPQTFFKKVLTNQEVCGTINSRGEGKAVPQRERPTRVSKTYSRWPDRTVFLCAGYKCEPDHAGWKNVVDTQDTQATLFAHNGREFCPLPMNGVECRRINSRGLSPFFPCTSLFLMPADFLFHRRHQTFFKKMLDKSSSWCYTIIRKKRKR